MQRSGGSNREKERLCILAEHDQHIDRSLALRRRAVVISTDGSGPIPGFQKCYTMLLTLWKLPYTFEEHAT